MLLDRKEAPVADTKVVVFGRGAGHAHTQGGLVNSRVADRSNPIPADRMTGVKYATEYTLEALT